jgi:membrane protein DedA with SNARE-associated domain
LPLPEEVTLISVGILAFMGSHPHIFPPPFEGAPVVNVHVAAWVSFFAVVGSDTLIYFIGRVYGRRAVAHPRMQRFVSPEAFAKVENWTNKYGIYAVAMFRFTPGVRFPGHIACGMLRLPLWKFLAVDGIAALLSVPTQVYLIAFYGEAILSKLQEFKYFVAGVLILVLLFLGARWVYRRYFSTPQPSV